jgi:recombinational DNA repair protein (RecF pathway)
MGRNAKDWPVIVGECYHCKEVKDLIQRSTRHRNNICEPCTREKQREYSRKQAEKDERRREGVNGRYPYPLQGWEYMNQKFNSISKELKDKEREESIEIIRRNLDNVWNNKEVMDWIWMQDAGERKEQQKKRGEARRRESQYIDTRNIDWDDFETMGFGMDEDN